MIICNELWTFLTEISVNDKSCSVYVEAVKFLQDNFIPYSGVENLSYEIDTEDDNIYHFQELASTAIVNYILEGMPQVFKDEFSENFLKK